VLKPSKRLVFYVDTECSYSTEGKCSYYSSKKTQEEAAEGRRQIWSRGCCPIVYVKTGRNKFSAFCPTRGGAFGEQIPSASGPSPGALRVEVLRGEKDSWADVVEKAAKIACSTKC
jgi:hypothetical protein